MMLIRSGIHELLSRHSDRYKIDLFVRRSPIVRGTLNKARDGLKINGGTLHWIAGTHRCFVGDEKLTKGIVFV